MELSAEIAIDLRSTGTQVRLQSDTEHDAHGLDLDFAELAGGIHVELEVPSDLAQTRLATAIAAGGRLLDQSEDRRRVTDPEGNEIVIVSRA